ncbi:hypothetical protein F3K20_12735 [Streptomyces scabiei]|uniref:WhiB family transcriptional regulator n=1 Tax=Streptomyces scabiei TaxID=1930 RepID=UPI001B3074F4|nr:WhiB family transcriptional regulator [Streptomyces sp. LBUM 1482]QTU45615.1 hypothetical protein F3K20_12735 [Streptomyces sp. LBUM 1482]
MPTLAAWHERAACAGQDTELWFPKQPIDSPAMNTCRACPSRAECLYDALRFETHGSPRYGIRGGLTTGQRRNLPPLEGPKAVTIAALRTLLDEIDTQGGPEAARQNRLDLDPLTERTPPMTTAPALRPTPPVVDVQLKNSADVRLREPQALPVGQLLKWGDQHHDPEIQDQAARARAALAGLRQRHTADQELTAITTEAQQLEKRLAELRAREAELVPAKQKRARKPVDYPAAEVRAWAQQNGHDCPPVGRVPKRILDAWRTATAA